MKLIFMFFSCVSVYVMFGCSMTIDQISTESVEYPVESVVQKMMINSEEIYKAEEGGEYPYIVVKATPMGETEFESLRVYYAENTFSELNKKPFSTSKEFYQVKPFRYLGSSNKERGSQAKVIGYTLLPKFATVGV